MDFPINVVIFGCDNSGKTTLANKIVEFINNSIYVRSLGPNKTVEEQIKFMVENLNVNRVNIFDRFPCIEENVCGNVLRGKNNFDGLDTSAILNKVDLFIFCYPGLLNVLNWGSRDQLSGVKENVVELINGYTKYAKYLIDKGYNVLEYNYKETNCFDRIFYEIKKIEEGKNKKNEY